MGLPRTFFPPVVDAMQEQVNAFRIVEEKVRARALHEPERLELIK